MSYSLWSLFEISTTSFLVTGLLPASPVRKGGVKGSYTKMAIFLTGKPRPGGRGGFTGFLPPFVLEIDSRDKWYNPDIYGNTKFLLGRFTL
jgi:hypothetical protein